MHGPCTRHRGWEKSAAGPAQGGRGARPGWMAIPPREFSGRISVPRHRLERAARTHLVRLPPHTQVSEPSQDLEQTRSLRKQHPEFPGHNPSDLANEETGKSHFALRTAQNSQRKPTQDSAGVRTSEDQKAVTVQRISTGKSKHSRNKQKSRKPQWNRRAARKQDQKET